MPYSFGNRVFYRFQRMLSIPLLKLLCRFKVRGPLPPVSGPLIVAANHESLMDPLVLQAALNRRLHYLMTSVYYFKPSLNFYSRIMRCIPVMEGRFNREALRTATEVLAEGRCIGVFPQGRIRRSGDMESGLRGIALMAVKSGPPVLPVRIRGTGRVLPKGARFIRPAAIEVHRGNPIVFSMPAKARPEGRRGYLETVTKSIMKAIERL